MTVVLLLVLGGVVAWSGARLLAPVLASPVLARENYRGRQLPTAAGLCLVVAVIGLEGVRNLVADETTTARLLVLLAAVSFGFLGFLDDVLGDATDRGLRGHLRAAVRGRWTTGFVKLAGGAAAGVAVASLAADGSAEQVIVDGALIALAANLGNLFDRAPGRTVKWAMLAYVPLAAVAGDSSAGTAIAPVIGASAGLLPDDLRERHMLGDTGANAIGAALGTFAVLELSTTGRVATAATLLALNALSEMVSFSRIIGAVPPLRVLDRLGRLP